MNVNVMNYMWTNVKLRRENSFVFILCTKDEAAELAANGLGCAESTRRFLLLIDYRPRGA